MDLIMTAVVDIATLGATGRALRATPADSADAMRKRLRSRLRTQLRRALRAYIGVLSRSKRGEIDEALVAACRVAAEERMPDAVERQEALHRLMATEAGALDGLPAARQDLWRLAHLILCARQGEAALLGRPDSAGRAADEARKAAKTLRRGLRRSLVAYCRALQGGDKEAMPMIARGRAAALRSLSLLQEPLDTLHRLPADGSDNIPASISRLVHGAKLDWEGPEAGTRRLA